MATDAMSIRLKLNGIRVVGVVSDLEERLEVVVIGTKTVVRCPFCGFRTTKVHETKRVRISDLPVLGAPTTLVWLRRCFSCANCCERHTEDHPSFDGSITTRLRRRIVCDARHLSIKEISRRYPVSWWRAMEIVRSHTEIVVRHRRAKPCRVLLVDETSLRRRHRYVTVASNGETGEALAVIKHRDQRALSSFLLSQGNR